MMLTTKPIPGKIEKSIVLKPGYMDFHQNKHNKNNTSFKKSGEVLFITSYPPRECGIATYTHDLISALQSKFSKSFTIRICPLESENEQHIYAEDIRYTLNVDHPEAFSLLATDINKNHDIKIVMIQHEFGFFENKETEFNAFVHSINKPVSLVFHTVLPKPDKSLKSKVQSLSKGLHSIIVMTNSSAEILVKDYDIARDKITVISHGTHLVKPADKEFLKDKYKLTGKKVLSTFGFLGKGKSIETTLEALPDIIKSNPEVIFLIIGKTHPSTIKREGEVYRMFLEEKVKTLKLDENVMFINVFLPLTTLLEYLQMTDIYLFTSKDPNQAVSGTFSYATSCGCPIISTPIPHAREVLRDDAGIIIDFGNAIQLADAVNSLLKDDQKRNEIGLNGLHRMASTAWENSAIEHARLFEKISKKEIRLNYNLPAINLTHIRKLTTDFGMIQFSKINQPDIESGYTLDDNARAMVAMCQHYKLSHEEEDVKFIRIYFNFIKYCLRVDGNFLNYIDKDFQFTAQNDETNLEDSNGRAIWALGYLISEGNVLPVDLVKDAIFILDKALENVTKIHSSRAMAFIIKGLYYANENNVSANYIDLIRILANRLVQMYRHESKENWQWYEGYLTYGNSVLPEAMLCAWMSTGDLTYKETAKITFDFLLSRIFVGNSIKVISNKTWLHRGKPVLKEVVGGEQPIDVAYTILALKQFYFVFKNEEYLKKMKMSFNWFLGDNHLHQIIYNPCTGGCYDGLEEFNVNLNQGAESTVSYLMARLTM